MPDATKAKIEARGNAVLNAATCLIGMARMAERSERRGIRSVDGNAAARNVNPDRIVGGIFHARNGECF